MDSIISIDSARNGRQIWFWKAFYAELIILIHSFYFSTLEMAFKLIGDGPGEKDALRGDTDLIQNYSLGRIIKLVLAGEGRTGQVGDYLEKIPHGKEFRK